MATAQLNRITQHIRRTLTAQALGEATDAKLLERYTTQQDEAAFAVLVRRHGPMVLGVCRRVLHNLHDAEDAFQAAFLLLARKAGSIRQGESVASWLFAVGRRLALKVRAGTDRRHAFEDQVKAMAPTEALPDLPAFGPEQRSILDEELSRLPDKFRTALVVCYLEGKTRAEAARHLGWKPGAVKKRLERGRDLLRARLTRRGLTVAAGALATGLPEAGPASAISPALVDATVRVAMLLGTGDTALAGIVSERCLALVEGMRKAMLLAKLKIATTVFLAVAVLGTGTTWFMHPSAVAQAPPQAAPAPAAAKPAPTDVHGDPLPSGARARLGTLRFRHESNVTFVAYTADGKHLITATQNGVIRKWDAASGKELLQFGKPPAMPELGDARGDAMQLNGTRGFTGLGVGLAPDGRTLASAQGNAVTLWDVANGKKIREWMTSSPIVTLAFAPDGKSLVSRGQDLVLHLWDVAEGKEIRKFGKQRKSQQGFSSYEYHGYGGADARVVFSSDGKVVAALAVEKDQVRSFTVVKRWEVASGRELPAVKSSQGIFEFVALAADGKTTGWCGMGGSSEGRLLDLESGKELCKIEGAESIVAFSPDVKALVGRTGDQGLGLWDATTGKLRHKLTDVSGQVAKPRIINVGNDFGGGENAAFSADGQRVAVAVGAMVRQWEVAGGKEINPSAGHVTAISSVAFAADGKSVLTRGADRTLRTWDAAGREIQKLALPAASHAVLSRDGRTLVLASEGTIHLWDTKARKELRQWKAHDEDIAGLALSADGELIASRSPDRTIRVWDVATGKELRQIAEPGNGGNGNQGAVLLPDFDSYLLGLIFSPDGATLAELPAYRQRTKGFEIITINGQAVQKQSMEKSIRLWDVATGKLKHRFAEPRTPIAMAVFAPDARTIATANADGTVSLWETLSGKERLQWKAGLVTALTFSPDGTFLVAGSRDGAIRFFDAATGKELAQHKGHRGSVSSVALSANGKKLVTGSSDTTALVWDVPALDLDKIAPVNLESAQVETLWNALAGADPAKAHQAIRTLSAVPGQVLPLLQSRLKPIPVPDPQHISQLIADLDSKQFSKRQKAEDLLEKLGDLAEPALKQVLTGKPTLETRQRVEKLREKIVSCQTPTPEVLQALRALVVLERLGTREARLLLDKLSKGAAGARQTREARGTLGRLARKR